MRKPKAKIAQSYQTRLAGYERDKKNLVRTMPHLPAEEFAEKLKELQNKWRV